MVDQAAAAAEWADPRTRARAMLPEEAVEAYLADVQPRTGGGQAYRASMWRLREEIEATRPPSGATG